MRNDVFISLLKLKPCLAFISNIACSGLSSLAVTVMTEQPF